MAPGQARGSPGATRCPAGRWEHTLAGHERADRGREFTWVVGQSWVRWSYTFTPYGGTRVYTES